MRGAAHILCGHPIPFDIGVPAAKPGGHFTERIGNVVELEDGHIAAPAQTDLEPHGLRKRAERSLPIGGADQLESSSAGIAGSLRRLTAAALSAGGLRSLGSRTAWRRDHHRIRRKLLEA